VCTDDLSRLGPVDLVVSNPPYIPDAMVPRDPEVAEHDPPVALFGGPDGLDVVRCVVNQAALLLRPGGRVLIEHGEEQGPALQEMLSGFEGVRTWPDLGGRPRVTGGRRPAGATPGMAS
jgi:release factor glutamine methyltransferase